MFKITAVAAALATALAATSVAPAHAGTVNDWVGADEDVYYYVTFEGGDWAWVELIGYDSDVDLWIYDEYGNLVCKSTGLGSIETCSWVPDYTQTYKIRVENWRKPTGTDFELSYA